MHYAAQLSAPRSILVPLLALAIGAGGAVGTYALLDDTDVSIEPTKVIVANPPLQSTIPGKDEARAAAAVSTSSLAGTSGKDEARTAAAIGSDDRHIGGGPPAESNDVEKAAPTPPRVFGNVKP
jgi:hypothetical protein